MKIISIIPARGGSKGIPLKNLAILNKKSLLSYNVNASLNSKIINRTIVSTDHPKIIKESLDLGAEVILRPKKLADDKSSLETSIIHVLDTLKEQENYIPDIIIILQNTSPLRTSKHIDDAFNLFKKNNYDSVFSGFLSHYFFWEYVKGHFTPMNYNPLKRPNRQQIKDRFIENGAIFITKYDCFKKSKCRMSGKIGIYEMPEELSYQIDVPNDLFIVTQMLKKQNLKDKK